jgi:GTPase SAR1 family protein
MELRQYAEPDLVIVLVGNKLDLVENNLNVREVFSDDIKAFVDEHKVLSCETSALKNENVNEAFEDLLVGKNKINKEIYNTKQRSINNLTSTPFGYSSYIANGNGGNLVKMAKNNYNEHENSDSNCCR